MRGDPGKGKTMLLCGIINELSDMNEGLHTALSFFVCQDIEKRTNSDWASLPNNQYYLATGIGDLQIAHKYTSTGNLKANPIHLSENLI